MARDPLPCRVLPSLRPVARSPAGRRHCRRAVARAVDRRGPDLGNPDLAIRQTRSPGHAPHPADGRPASSAPRGGPDHPKRLPSRSGAHVAAKRRSTMTTAHWYLPAAGVGCLERRCLKIDHIGRGRGGSGWPVARALVPAPLPDYRSLVHDASHPQKVRSGLREFPKDRPPRPVVHTVLKAAFVLALKCPLPVTAQQAWAVSHVWITISVSGSSQRPAAL